MFALWMRRWPSSPFTSNSYIFQLFCTPKLFWRRPRLRVSGRCLVRRHVHERCSKGWKGGPLGCGSGVQNRENTLPFDLSTSGGPMARFFPPISIWPVPLHPGGTSWDCLVLFLCSRAATMPFATVNGCQWAMGTPGVSWIGPDRNLRGWKHPFWPLSPTSRW